MSDQLSNQSEQKSSGEEMDRLTDHSYDGIQEYDNPLPFWWLLTFFVTIIFGALYYLHYETGSGPNLDQELQAALQVIETQKAAHGGSSFSPVELESSLAAADVSNGLAAFKAKCAACHGNQLEGGIGPNLTDEFWLHGKGGAGDIAKTINQGVPEKGMPKWEGMMSRNELFAVVKLILEKQDSHPGNAKAPQGEKVR